MSPLAPPAAGTVVTVGTFDGVHVGHQAVLAEIARRARARERASVLVTFEPHPLAIVNPMAAPPRLTTATERLEVLASSELDRVMVLRFDRTMATMRPEAFVREVLVRDCGMRELVIGHDHGFGHGRQGDAATLRTLGAELGFEVDIVGPVSVGGGQAVSSTSIRRAIAGGDLETAARQLGRRYTVSSRVRRGAARGRTIGFPTLNLGIPGGKLLPPDGVWVVEVETPAGRFGGMMNQGHRPTFDDGRRVLEVHLLDVEVDLYDRMVRVEWLAPLRPIRRFDGAASLRQQLGIDAERARATLAGAPHDLDAPPPAPE